MTMGIQQQYMMSLFDTVFAGGPTLSLPLAELTLLRFETDEKIGFLSANEWPRFYGIISGEIIDEDSSVEEDHHGPPIFIWIPPNVHTKVKSQRHNSDTPIRILSAKISPDLIEKVVDKLMLGPLMSTMSRTILANITTDEWHPVIADCICSLLNYFICKKPDRGFLVPHKLEELVYFLIRNYCLCEKSNTMPGYKHSEPVVRAIMFMLRNLSNRISLDDLSQYCNLSASRLNTIFREETGEPPLAYLIRLRMNYARQLLGIPGTSITEIAFEVGYEGVAHFIHQFRKVMAITPNQYRQILRWKKTHYFDPRSFNLENQSILVRSRNQTKCYQDGIRN